MSPVSTICRCFRHIVETGLTLLSKASVPKSYWPYAFAVAVYLINRLPTPVLSMQSPYQKLFARSPNYDKLRVFGCACFPWLRPYNRHKLEDRSLQCVFLGYSLTQSAYMCLHRPTGRIYISRHVQFDETLFPFSTTTSNSSPHVDLTSNAVTNWSHTVTIPATNSTMPRQPPCSPLHQRHTSSPTADHHLLSSSHVSSSNSYSPSVSLFSEPTAPNTNGPQPTAQQQTQSNSNTTSSPYLKAHLRIHLITLPKLTQPIPIPKPILIHKTIPIPKTRLM